MPALDSWFAGPRRFCRFAAFATAHGIDNANLWNVAVGVVHWRLNDPAAALECYQRVLPQLEGDATFQMLRGMAARKLPDQRHIAEAAYERALELDPMRSDALPLGYLYRDDRPLMPSAVIAPTSASTPTSRCAGTTTASSFCMSCACRRPAMRCRTAAS